MWRLVIIACLSAITSQSIGAQRQLWSSVDEASIADIRAAMRAHADDGWFARACQLAPA